MSHLRLVLGGLFPATHPGVALGFLDAFQAVKVSDIAEVLVKYPLTSNSTIAIGPLKELESIP